MHATWPRSRQKDRATVGHDDRQHHDHPTSKVILVDEWSKRRCAVAGTPEAIQQRSVLVEKCELDDAEQSHRRAQSYELTHEPFEAQALDRPDRSEEQQ